MRRIFTILILGIIFIATFGALWLFVGHINTPAIIGYDGPVATLHEIEHKYPTTLSGPIVNNGPSSATIDPGTPDLYDVINPCGLKFTMSSAPIVEGTPEKIDEIVKAYPDDDTQTNKTKTWQVYEVTLHMGVTIETWHGGLLDSPGATFWIHLQNNPNSIFSNADEQIAYFVEVVTYESAEITGVIEVYGEDQGYAFDRVPVTTSDVPQWILDSGYTTAAGQCSDIKFPVELISAAPTTIVGAVRQESEAELHIQIQVILFGMWERVVPYIKWDNPTPPGLFDWLWELLAALVTFLWYVIGIIGTVIIAWKVPDPRFKVIGILLIWTVILWQTGALAMLMGVLGG